MAYDIGELPLGTLLPALARAEDQLARLDEVVRRSPVGEGYAERGHFFDAAATMWVAGQLVHVEDLVLHDARMDVRAPTHELILAHSIVRSRRRIAGEDPDWAVRDGSIAVLAGIGRRATSMPVASGGGEGPAEPDDDEHSFTDEFAEIDAILSRSKRALDDYAAGASREPEKEWPLMVGELVIRDPQWDEQDRLAQWRRVMSDVASAPPTLAAAVLFDAWEALEPLQNQHALGGQLVAAYLRFRGKVESHLPTFSVGLKAIVRERRRARDRATRLVAFLDALSLAAEGGLKEIARLAQASDQMERRLRGRRASSSLPAAIELVLQRPVVSAEMVAKAAKVTPRGALNLIADLGIREMTGRGRYRAWGIV